MSQQIAQQSKGMGKGEAPDISAPTQKKSLVEPKFLRIPDLTDGMCHRQGAFIMNTNDPVEHSDLLGVAVFDAEAAFKLDLNVFHELGCVLIEGFACSRTGDVVPTRHAAETQPRVMDASRRPVATKKNVFGRTSE